MWSFYLYLYQDIKTIAKPFVEKSKRLEKELFSDVVELSFFSFFRLDKIKPFYVADYTLKDPHIALSDQNLRISQRSLYNRCLFETPDFIKERINDNEFVIWQDKNNEFEYYCSTKWDTSVILLRSKRNKITLCNMLPAKGSRRIYLDVNELNLNDKADSKTLFEAFGLLEKLLDMKLSYLQEFDC